MKKSLIALLIIALAVACQKKEDTHNLHISGEVKGLKKGILYIQKMVDTTLVAVDTIKIDGDSHFSSALDIASPQMYYLFLDRGVTNSLDNNLPFFAEPGNIKIETKLDLFLSGAKISGSKNNEKYQEYKKIKSRFIDRNLELTEKKLLAFQFNHSKTIDSIEQLQDVNTKRHYLATVNFAVNNKDLELAPYLALAEIPNVSLKYLTMIEQSMTPKVGNSFYGKQLTAFYNERKKSEAK